MRAVIRTGATVLTLALAVLPSPAEAQFTSGPTYSGTTSFELSREPAVPFGPGSVDVRVQGQAQSLSAIERIAVSEILIYFDLPLSSADNIERTAELLAERSAELVELGSVRVVAGSVVPEVLTPPTRDVEALEQALQDAALLASESGEILELRREMLDLAAEQSDNWQPDLHELLVQEHQIIDWQFQTLLEQLTTVPGQENRVLFLVQDGFDLSPLDAIRRNATLTARFERRAMVHDPAHLRELARTLAAEGWLVVPIAITEEAAEEADESAGENLIAARDSVIEEWTSASGSRVADRAAALDTILERLELRYLVRWQSSLLIDSPTPIDLLFSAPDVSPTWRRWTSTVTPPALVAARAERFLSDALSDSEADLGERTNEPNAFGLDAVLLEDSASGAILQVQIQGDRATIPTSTTISGGRYRFTLVSKGFDTRAETTVTRGDGEILGEGLALQYQNRVEIPSDFQAAALVVEDLETRHSGVVLVELSDRALPVPQAAPKVAQIPDGDRSTTPVETRSEPTREVEPEIPASGTQSGAPPPEPRISPRGRQGQPTAVVDSAPTRTDDNSLVQIVPPRRANLEGTIEIKTLVTNPAIRAVRFLLDGQEVATDQRAPFGTKIDLGSGVAEHEIVAIALSRSDIEMGSDTLVINKPGVREGVFLSRVERATDGNIDVAAELNLPAESSLDRIEFYRNQLRVATLTAPPFETRLPGGATGPADFVRVVAWSREGRFFEDVLMLDDQGASERVDVNLVQVYAVVTDRAGKPVQGLARENFLVKRKGEVQEIDRFAVAEEVPLVLGLVVDTSESMMMIMQDTRKAAATFLGETIGPIDKGFVVDFDNQPRLAHGVTGKVFDLLGSLGSLQADGSTALYDSIVFSLLQFGENRGRHALVVLSDGDDYRSRFGFNRTWNDAKASGVPIYVLELSGLDPERPSFRKDDLEVIATDSGGRVFYAKSMTDVEQAYEVITEELRNQYVLGFTTDRSLSLDELAKIKVEVEGQGRLKVRSTVGQATN